MLLGHIGIALAAKPAAPKASLGVLVVASDALDLLCFGFAAAGIERISLTPPKRTTSPRPDGSAPAAVSLPWSHGLLMSAVWSAAAAAIAGRVYRDRRTASVIGLVVFSHWVLDVIAHAPDLPLLFTGSPTVGLGLEYSADGEIHWRRALAAELGLLAAGAVVNHVATHDAGRHAP